jgi:hypothetical protein
MRECPVCDPKAAAAEPVHAGVVEAPARVLEPPFPATDPTREVTPSEQDVPVRASKTAASTTGPQQHTSRQHTDAGAPLNAESEKPPARLVWWARERRQTSRPVLKPTPGDGSKAASEPRSLTPALLPLPKLETASASPLPAEPEASSPVPASSAPSSLARGEAELPVAPSPVEALSGMEYLRERIREHAALALKQSRPIPADDLSMRRSDPLPETDPADPLLPSLTDPELSGNPLDDLLRAMGLREAEPTDPPVSGRIPIGLDAVPAPIRALKVDLQHAVRVSINPGPPSELSAPPPELVLAEPVAVRRDEAESAAGSASAREVAPIRIAPHVADSVVRPVLPSAPALEQPFDADHADAPEPAMKGALPVAQPHAVSWRQRGTSWPPETFYAGHTRFPQTPVLLPAPPLAPLRPSASLERSVSPAHPSSKLLKPECQPRITLPGPTLIKRLISFRDKELTPVFMERKPVKKPAVPQWVVTALILGTLLGAGFSSFFSLSLNSAEATQKAATQTAVTATPAPAAAVETAASPLSRMIEVSGFRFLTDPNQKAEIQYLVVNHSPDRFSGVNVFVTLHTTDAKAGEPPLCRFSFAAPNLGPYASKEMTSSIEKLNRPVSMLDWQNFRAEIEVGQ